MGDSLRSTPVTNVAYLTLNGNFGNNNNDAQLTFRPLNKDLAPVSGNYYSLATNQTTDPSLRINQWSSTGQLVDYGFLYDNKFNLPPSTRTVVAGGYGTTNTLYSLDNGFSWILSESGSAEQSECTSIAFNGSLWVAGGLGKLLYSGDGIIWTPSPNAESLIVDANGNGSVFGLAANGSLWVAGCGDSSNNNNLLYSYDGIYWRSSATSPALLGNCNAIAWNGSLWIATGAASSGSPILYSYDGIIWYSSVYTGTPFSQGLSIAWNGFRWIVGGQNDISGNTIASSSDGINWTYDTFPLEYVRTIAYNAGLWLIGGLSATDSLFFSEDGYTWTPVPDSKTLLNDCNAIIWTGTVWLAGGQGTNTIIRSFDGLNWLSANNAPLLSSGCLALAVNNVLPNAPLNTIQPPFLLLGGPSGIPYSSDGITWESIRSSQASCNTLLWNGSLWLGGFLYLSNSLGYSYDGLTWNTSSNGSLYLLDGCYAFAADGHITLAGGAGTNRIIYSYNGRDWATIPSADSLFNNNSCLTIGYNGTQWVAGSDSSNNRLIYSSDPSGTWLASASGNALFPSSCYSVAWNGAIWVAVGDTIADSSDGINWTQAATIPIDIYWRTVAYNGSLWVAGGIGATPIAYSYDGSIWRAATVANSIARCYSVTWTGSLWIAAVGNTASAAYSYNGITWFASPNSNSVMNRGYAVAAKRLNPTSGVYLPPPVLNPVAAEQPGQIVYSTGLNNLYVSSIMSINDGSGEVQIQGDISASTIHTTTLYVTSNVIANDLSLNTIEVISLTGSNAMIEDISASTLSVWSDLSASTIYVYDLSASAITADTIDTSILYVTSNIIANDLSLNTIEVISLTGSNIIASDLSLNTIEVITLTGSNIAVEDISASTISVWTDLSASTIHVYDLSANSLSANTIYVDALSANTMETNTLSVFTSLFANDLSLNTIEVDTITGVSILTQDISADRITVTYDLFAANIYVTDLSASNTISVNTINVDTINGVNIITEDITADRISAVLDLSATMIHVYDMSANTISVETLYASTFSPATINTGDVSANTISVGTLYASTFSPATINTGDVSANTISVTNLYASTFSPATINTGDVSANRISATDISAGNLDAQNLNVSGITAPTLTVGTLNAGVILGTGSPLPIGTIANPSAINITNDRTTIQNADLSGIVIIGKGTEYGKLLINVGGTADGPTCQINPVASDSSGSLALYANTTSFAGIFITPTVTQISNPRVVSGSLLIDNGTIGKTTANPNAIVIGNTRTMVQNADLSGTVYIGNGDISGALQIQSGATGQASLLVNTAASGQLTLGSSVANPNAIVITDTSGTIIQNADLSGTVYIGHGPIEGALQITGGDISGAIQSLATIRPNSSISGQFTLGSSAANPNAIVITDTSTTIQNMTLTAVSVTGTIESSGAIVSSGAIASSLPIGSRGSGLITSSSLNIISVSIWTYTWTVPSSAQQYSVFLVSVNATVQLYSTEFGSAALTANASTKWFSFYPFQDIMAPGPFSSGSTSISTTFIVNNVSNNIVITGTTYGSNYSFVHATPSYSPLTTIEIIGLA